MISSDLITPTHLARHAVVYIRQSSPQQVISHQESLRLQYDLRQRAADCGWPDSSIDIIDNDLGLTARTTQGRAGFAELVSRVTLGDVGIIFSYDVSRLSRNCSDWYQLLDLCSFRHCLIGDHDSIYDPSSINGRMLLGLK
jgi:DNA invertase Pin-like site-specific DNA recombinase